MLRQGLLIIFFCLNLVVLVWSQGINPPCSLPIGTNLAGPSDYGSEWPFVNIMKYSRRWITHNQAWVASGTNAWDTNFLDRIPLDTNGYPLALPVLVAGAEAPQIVRTVWANTATLPAGRYVILFDGQGEIDVWGDAKKVASTPGRLEFDLTPGRDNIFALELLRSVAGNHLRNIRVLLPGTEATYQQNPWSQAWLDKLQPFRTLRFMDWTLTNNSTLQHWNDRPVPSDYTYTLRGIPYEWIIALANRQAVDVWICVPHQADAGYLEKMARLFRDQLAPPRKIYLEYSNEIWNWIFDQAQYGLNAGNQKVPWPERTVPFIQNTFDIWSRVFAGQMNRLVRVVGVQHAWQDVSNRVVFNLRPGSFDAFAPAAYFGFSERGYQALAALGANATASDVLRWAREGMLQDSYAWTRSQQREIAQRLGIPMLFYEGGQHLTPNPFGSEQPYNAALMAAQSDPRMYNLYQEWLDSLRTFIPQDRPGLFMHFSFIAPRNGRYGSWGALESQFSQNAPYHQSAPKYQFLLDQIANCNPRTSSEATPPALPLTLSPNPNNGTFTLRSTAGQFTPGTWMVFNLTGNLIGMGPWQQAEQTISLSLPAGAYLLRVQQGLRTAHTRLVVTP